jgi:hypothetical protein
LLFKTYVIERVGRGEITSAFRRWRRPSVKQGSTLRTAIGVLLIAAIELVSIQKITAADAKRAGHASLDELRAELDKRCDGGVYKISFRLAGPDPQVALRECDALTLAECKDIANRLRSFDCSSRSGPWTSATLGMININSGITAGVLAKTLGIEKPRVKRLVRKLKDLGLTESLTNGYRLSARGQKFLTMLDRPPFKFKQ